MFKKNDEPESPHDGACLRKFCQQQEDTRTHTRARPECFPDHSQEALPQVLALFRHGAKILTHGQKDLGGFSWT